MANSYVPGKWNGTLSADLVGDATKTTPTLGDDYDSELRNLKKAQANIKATIKSIKKEISALKNHQGTGKMAKTYLGKTETKLGQIQDELDREVNLLSNAVTKAQKEEWARFKKVIAQWAAAQGIKF